ncbi:MAG: hypothetical protein Q9170_007270 [Blastenia crenularia]
MSTSDSDEDLKRAIQLSLQTNPHVVQTGKQHSNSEIINLDSDDESTTDDSPEDTGTLDKLDIESEPPPRIGMLGLDRKAMEQERLARKRKTSISPPPLSRKAAKFSEPRRDVRVVTQQGNQMSGSSLPTSTRLPFPNGAVKKTWAFGHPRHDDIKLEEVLQKNDLSMAVLSSFQWDVEWLLRKIDTRKTQLTFIMQADNDEVKAQYRRETAAMKNLRLCFPSMEGQIKCMHSKLMLLSYPTHLRVAVPTANLVSYDWGETGIMENMVFLIDLPRLPAGQVVKEDEMTQFGQDLVYFLEATGLDQTIIDSVHNFDFSATGDLAFVHTIGGAHFGDYEPWRRTGYCGLGRAISNLGLLLDKPLAVDYVTSSVGSLNMDYLCSLYLATQGDDGMTEYDARCKQQVKKTANLKWILDLKERLQKQVSEGFCIYYPSDETVKASKGGPESGGTICFQKKWWHADTFPRQLMRDCKSGREGMLMHNKILFVRPKTDSASTKLSNSKAWAYIGSANCSESAWGRLVKDRKEKQPKLNCRNWECGVVIPLRRTAVSAPDGDRITHGADREDLSSFERLIPIPMEYPGKDLATMSSEGSLQNGKDRQDGRKNVVIIGGGAAGMSAAATLAQHPTKFNVTILERMSVVGGQATSIPLDENRYGTSWMNDGVQGGSPAFKHTLHFFQQYGHKEKEVKLQVSFGQGKDSFWTNAFPSQLVDQFSGDIKKFGKVLKLIKYTMPVLGLIPIRIMLRMFFFSKDFGDKMVFPLIALFLGTGNQTANVSCAILERLFDDPNMKLWDYDSETLLPNLPLMVTFPKLESFYADWAADLKSKGVTIRTNTDVISILSRNSKTGIVLQTAHFNPEDKKRDGDGLGMQNKNAPATTETYDELIMCVLADDAKKLLGKTANWKERFVLGGAKFFDDITITHSDSDYFQKNYETRFSEELCAKPKSKQQEEQIAFAKNESTGPDNEAGGYRPMYYTHSYKEDMHKIEMAFDCTNYQHQFRQDPSDPPAPHKSPVPYENHVFQSIFLDKTNSHLWTIDQIDESKIIERKWWHQLGHRWQHYVRVVPNMMFINRPGSATHTTFAGSWTLVNMHEMACVSGIAAAYRLGAEYEVFDDFAEDLLRKYLLISHGVRYKGGKKNV